MGHTSFLHNLVESIVRPTQVPDIWAALHPCLQHRFSVPPSLFNHHLEPFCSCIEPAPLEVGWHFHVQLALNSNLLTSLQIERLALGTRIHYFGCRSSLNQSIESFIVL